MSRAKSRQHTSTSLRARVAHLPGTTRTILLMLGIILSAAVLTYAASVALHPLVGVNKLSRDVKRSDARVAALKEKIKQQQAQVDQLRSDDYYEYAGRSNGMIRPGEIAVTAIPGAYDAPANTPATTPAAPPASDAEVLAVILGGLGLLLLVAILFIRRYALRARRPAGRLSSPAERRKRRRAQPVHEG